MQYIYYPDPEPQISDKGEQKDTLAAPFAPTAELEEEFGPRLPPPG